MDLFGRITEEKGVTINPAESEDLNISNKEHKLEKRDRNRRPQNNRPRREGNDRRGNNDRGNNDRPRRYDDRPRR